MVSATGRALLERGGELEAIATRLDRACAGEGSLLVVEGPAGIGKTALLGAAAEQATERGMTVLRARGGVLEQQLEYGVVRQLVEKPVLRASPERQAELLAGPAAAATAALGFGELPADPGPGGDPSPQIQHALHWLIANMAEEGPLLIVVDDAHWGDAASLRAGGYLARRLAGTAVAILVASRDDEPNSQQGLLAELFAAAEPTYLRLRPLSEEAVAEVLRDAFAGQAPPPQLIEACRAASGGNPFLLTELAAELAANHPAPEQTPVEAVEHAGPVAVRRSLLLRLGNLGPDARRLAQAVAIMGGEAELRHAATVAEVEPAAAGEAAGVLAAAGILEPGMPLRMVHPLVRAAIAEDTAPSERSAAHRRAFEALAADGAVDQALLPHALAAEPAGDPQLVALLRRLAERALRTGTPSSSAVYLERALLEPPPPSERGATLAALGRAQIRTGDFGGGVDRLEQALAATGDSSVRADVHRERAFAAFASAGMGEARRIVAEAVTELDGATGDGALQLEADLALLAWLSGGEHGLDLRRHRDLGGGTTAERTILALLAQQEHAGGAPPDEVVELAVRALGRGRLIAEDTSEALSWYMATYALLTCEAHAEARETIAEAIADSQRRGSVFARAGALGTRAVLALNEGRPRDAEADAREAAAGAMPPIMVPVNAAYLVLSLVDQGDLEGAQAELEAAGIDQGPGGPTVLRWIPWARARLREAQGRTGDVRADVAPLQEDERGGQPMRALAWKALLSRALCRGGDPGPEAEALAREHLAWATGWGRPGALGVAQRAVALTQRGEERIAALEGAVQTLAGSSLRTEEARARLDLGIAHLRDGRRREGRQVLEEALALALEVGAQGMARSAAEELEIAGAAPRRLSFDELTASERRIAEHAAAGRTNREIAEQLFITPKTVENHLTRVYGKLGIGSRRELAGAL
ncbi:MAG TPA: AAA family ATPase [Solirubrobacterales bacterium]|nr:AAA family ATPase [Solirubrobacterales bacterium]